VDVFIKNTKEKMNKILDIIGLIGGISGLILILITLIINSFIPLIYFIPENNIFIRIFEILLGLFFLVILIKLLLKRLK
jgi:hypothetical protein